MGLQMSFIRTVDNGGIWVLHFARPPVNAIDLDLITALYEGLCKAADTSDCRGIVITGDPPAFSAGVDFKVVPQYDTQKRQEMIRSINRSIQILYGLPKPTVAAINGHALGGGLVAAIACDFRFAAEGSYQLGLIEITAGIPFPAVPMVVVKSELDRNTARSLTLSGSTFDPGSTPATKFIDQIYPPEKLIEIAINRAEASSKLRAYGKVKRQLKAEALNSIEKIVKEENDPMLHEWI
jgi:enoyl-CoA hydratase